MSFTHPDFLPFLLLVLGGVAFVPRRGRALFLLAASVAFSLFEPPWQLGVLVGSSAIDFVAGLLLARPGAKGARRAVLWTAVVLDIAMLIAAKTTGWLALGLSFYTFQSLSYTIDVYRRRIAPSRDPVEYLLYVAFFPQLLAGPIERARSLLPQLRALSDPDKRILTGSDLDRGARLVLWGLWKKLCLADRIRPWATDALAAPEEQDVLTLTCVALSFNVILYLDFSAYTDIARGAARALGIDLVKNFRHPYFARSLGDLARRWHTSLVDWIMDYVWSPLVRGPMTPWGMLRANCIVMTIFALWHELRLDLAALGCVIGALITLEQLPRLRGDVRPPSRARATLDWSIAASVWVVFSLSLFAPDGAAVVRFGRAWAEFGVPDGAALWAALGAFGFAVVGLVTHGLDLRVDLARHWERLTPPVRALVLISAALVIGRYGAARAQDFVYFRF